MDKIKQVENNLKMVLRHWGFGEICSSIYATLAVSDRPLTAREISERINYAYTTTINALNRSIGLRHIKKIRENGRNVYTIETDLSDIIRERLNYFLLLLEETEDSIRKLDGNLKAKLRGVFRMIDNAKNFIKKIGKTKAII
ncbi:MAG: hypothetical protein DRN12_05560 [Thermoplasmata archaeon]|nr:MAG: hypothetical protein DRN12_05560 [Thermoplasmata archaeon]HEC89082.1 hypothetical protein [Thermoplasmatales archaeon]